MFSQTKMALEKIASTLGLSRLPGRVKATIRDLFIFLLGPSPERQEAYLLQQAIRSGDTVLEVGANTGGSTQLISSIVGRTGQVISLEPNPYAIPILMRSVRSQKNVRALNVAAASSKGSAYLFLDNRYDVGAGITRLGKHKRRKIRTNTISLDQLVEILRIPRVDSLVIDAEGSELDILRGAPNLLARARCVLIEQHSALDPDIPIKVRSTLVSLNFKLWKSVYENKGHTIVIELYSKA